MAGKHFGDPRIRAETRALEAHKANVERLQMEPEAPRWVFRLDPYPLRLDPLPIISRSMRKYTIDFSGEIPPEKLFSILMKVEAEIRDAFIS